jgi:hypothetical protein
MQIGVAAGSASAGGKLKNATTEERILSNDRDVILRHRDLGGEKNPFMLRVPQHERDRLIANQVVSRSS